MHTALHTNALVAAADAAGVGIVVFIIFSVVIIVLAVLMLILAGQWRMFEKAGMPGWATIVPFYGVTKMLQMVNYPLWWIVLMLIPGVNMVLAVMLAYRLARVFGHGAWFTVGMIFLPFIFYPILGFGTSRYDNRFPPARALTPVVQWSLAALVLWMVMFSSVEIASIISSAGASSPQQLQQVGDDLGYVTDGNYVYYNDQLMPNADASSFTADGEYGIDDYAVYSGADALPGVDPQDFTVLQDGFYATTGTNVYYDGSLVASADSTSFDVLGNGYAKDARAAYYDGSAIPESQPDSFQVLDTDYAKTRVRSTTTASRSRERIQRHSLYYRRRPHKRMTQTLLHPRTMPKTRTTSTQLARLRQVDKLGLVLPVEYAVTAFFIAHDDTARDRHRDAIV